MSIDETSRETQIQLSQTSSRYINNCFFICIIMQKCIIQNFVNCWKIQNRQSAAKPQKWKVQRLSLWEQIQANRSAKPLTQKRKVKIQSNLTWERKLRKRSKISDFTRMSNDITSAGNKGSYAYDRLIELLVQSIVAPDTSFVFGCDYRVPVMHGLLNKKFIQELKLSGTYREDSFAREYLSINPQSQWTLNLFNCWKISFETISSQAI